MGAAAAYCADRSPVFVAGLAWALVTPDWQAPDENSHFAYTQALAERFALPGDPDFRSLWASEG